MPAVKSPAVVSADSIAVAAVKAWSIPVTGKDVRGLARGDTGTAVLPRFAERNADGTNRQHQYTPAEAGIVVRALAARKARRVPTVTAEPVLRALGLPLTAPKAAKTAASTTGRAKPTRPVNRALGERAPRVKASAAAPATTPDQA